MKRWIVTILAAVVVAVGLSTAVAAPAEACTYGVGGRIYHDWGSQRSHLSITNAWGSFPVYYLPEGWYSESVLPGSGCTSTRPGDDADGYHTPSGYVSMVATPYGWQYRTKGPAWTKVSDGTLIKVRLISCANTSYC
jgi:opacity protein-like surface antigen